MYLSLNPVFDMLFHLPDSQIAYILSLERNRRKIVEALTQGSGMDQLRMRFMGGVSIRLNDVRVSEVLGAKALALVCYLAVTGEPQTRSKLAGLLWSDFEEHRARSNLRDTLSALRRTQLAPFLKASRRHIAFNSDLPHWLDAAEFQLAARRSMQERPTDIAGLEQAVSHYRGEFLLGFYLPSAALFEEWVTDLRQQLRMLAIEAFQLLIDSHMDAGDYEAGIPFARQLLSLDTWREETHRTLMLLLVQSGQATAAVSQYEQCRKILAEELGVPPSKETQTLYENILKRMTVTPPEDGLPAVPVDFGPFGPVPNNLPGQITPFIGREEEQRAIESYLIDQSDRLITVVGVGGIGKTRLALAVGNNSLDLASQSGFSCGRATARSDSTKWGIPFS